MVAFRFRALKLSALRGDGLVQPFERHRNVALRHVELRQLEIPRRIVVVVPDGAVERVHRRFDLALLFEDQPQVVHRLAVFRTRIVLGLAFDRLAQVAGGLLVVAALTPPDAHLRVGARVARIAAQHLFEIVRGVDERVVELQVAHPDEIALLGVFDLFGTQRTLHDLRQRFVRVAFHGRVGQQLLACGVGERDPQVGRFDGLVDGDGLHERGVGCEIRLPREECPAGGRERDGRSGQFLRGVDAYQRFARGHEIEVEAACRLPVFTPPMSRSPYQ